VLEYGTKVIGVPGRAVKVWTSSYNNRKRLWIDGSIDSSVTFVPGPQVKDAVVEAIECGIKFIVVPAERVPLHDSLRMIALARERGTKILGPGSLGLISANKALIGWIGGTEEWLERFSSPAPWE
jgi:succinyl-CoA synthetase alpha subunit